MINKYNKIIFSSIIGTGLFINLNTFSFANIEDNIGIYNSSYLNNNINNTQIEKSIDNRIQSINNINQKTDLNSTMNELNNSNSENNLKDLKVKHNIDLLKNKFVGDEGVYGIKKNIEGRIQGIEKSIDNRIQSINNINQKTDLNSTNNNQFIKKDIIKNINKKYSEEKQEIKQENIKLNKNCKEKYKKIISNKLSKFDDNKLKLIVKKIDLLIYKNKNDKEKISKLNGLKDVIIEILNKSNKSN